MAAYDPTAIFTALEEAFGFLEKISPAITDWIEANIPLERQRITDRRMRKCKRICRKEKLNYRQIAAQVSLDFDELNPDLRSEIFDLLTAELNVKP